MYKRWVISDYRIENNRSGLLQGCEANSHAVELLMAVSGMTDLRRENVCSLANYAPLAPLLILSRKCPDSAPWICERWERLGHKMAMHAFVPAALSAEQGASYSRDYLTPDRVARLIEDLEQQVALQCSCQHFSKSWKPGWFARLPSATFTSALSHACDKSSLCTPMPCSSRILTFLQRVFLPAR